MGRASEKSKRCFQLFRDVDCVVSDIKKDCDLDDDLVYLLDSELHEILESLDLHRMKKHIINCMASLIEVAEKVTEMNGKNKLREKKEKTNVFMAENKVFSAAVSMMSQILTGKGYTNILEAFPDMESVGWHPLAWAVAVGDDKVEEEDIKCLYLADPMALDRPHLDMDVDIEIDQFLIGYSPAHILCMKAKPSLSLIRFLVGHNSMAFMKSCSSVHDEAAEFEIYPLHLAAEHSQSVELLQILLQLDKSVTEKTSASYNETPHTPLGILCRRGESPAVMDMILCLIKVDSSVEVIEDAISSCLTYGSKMVSSIQAESIGRYKLTLIELLLKANPEAAECQNRAIMHYICIHTNGDLFTSLMSLFLALNKDVLKECDGNGNLPIHIAANNQNLPQIVCLLNICPELVSIANDNGELPIHFAMQYKNLAVIDYLLGFCPESASKSNMNGELLLHLAVQYHSLALIDRLLKMYPEAASMITSRGMNILHCAMARHGKEGVEIATLIFTQFPNLLHERNGPIPDGRYERNGFGYTPFLLALANSNFKVATALCQIDEQVIRDVVICTEARPCTNLSNPLHIMIREKPTQEFEPVSEGADCFRLLISLYPEAAGIDNHNGKTPYEYARHNGEGSYMLRLLLRAAPATNPDELHRLNYAERRQAMFLAFRAIVSSSEVSIWRRLKMEDVNLLRYVVTFL